MVDPTNLPDPIHGAMIDGVDVLWADAPGPVQASLSFRVGMSDEPLIQPQHSASGLVGLSRRCGADPCSRPA